MHPQRRAELNFRQVTQNLGRDDRHRKAPALFAPFPPSCGGREGNFEEDAQGGHA